MDADQARTVVEQVAGDVPSPEMGPAAQPVKTRPVWRGYVTSILACLGGGGLLIAVVLLWGYWEFGSLSSTFAYLNGERLLVDPGTLFFGSAPRGEVRNLRVTIRNRTGREVKVLGAKSTCSCMGTEERFPFSLADGDQRDLTILVWLTGKDTAFEKRFDFYTDDEAHPVIAVAVRGRITD